MQYANVIGDMNIIEENNSKFQNSCVYILIFICSLYLYVIKMPLNLPPFENQNFLVEIWFC